MQYFLLFAIDFRNAVTLERVTFIKHLQSNVVQQKLIWIQEQLEETEKNLKVI